MSQSQQQQPRELDPNAMVPVTLPVGGWNTLIGILARAEGRGINWEIVDPLIGVIRQQVTQKATGNRGLRSVDEAS